MTLKVFKAIYYSFCKFKNRSKIPRASSTRSSGAINLTGNAETPRKGMPSDFTAQGHPSLRTRPAHVSAVSWSGAVANSTQRSSMLVGGVEVHLNIAFANYFGELGMQFWRGSYVEKRKVHRNRLTGYREFGDHFAVTSVFAESE